MLFLLFLFPNLNQFMLSVDSQSLIGLSWKELIKMLLPKWYFGFRNLAFLATFHGMNLTLRHLHCLMQEQNVFRRYNFTNLNDIIEVIEKETLGSREIETRVSSNSSKITQCEKYP